ncbi:MAG: HigA family addiction module antitoxin [Patescibacteria group bacterium]|jgi:addiction module HigA family antidote
MKKQKPIHPGEILLEDFLLAMEITQYRLAKDISVPARRINEIVHGNRAISPDTALRLAKYFGTSPEFWMNLQAHYDLELLNESWSKTIEKQVRVFQPA